MSVYGERSKATQNGLDCVYSEACGIFTLK